MEVTPGVTCARSATAWVSTITDRQYVIGMTSWIWKGHAAASSDTSGRGGVGPHAHGAAALWRLLRRGGCTSVRRWRCLKIIGSGRDTYAGNPRSWCSEYKH